MQNVNLFTESAGGRADRRVLIYSHDSFGLGHLRRCLAIAHSLVERHKKLSVLILSGSPIIGSFDFRARVDFVRVPGVIKLRNGEYTSLSLHISVEQTLELRASIIRHTALAFAPDIFIVDKEPLGLEGEVADTLGILKDRGTSLVLGLRDVMDEPQLLAPEWKRKNVSPALEDLYDRIWVYGLRHLWDPLDGLDLSGTIRDKAVFTGYLRRELPRQRVASPADGLVEGPFLLVTPGGGGDGEALVDWVLKAYECDPHIPYPSLIVFGPFMAPRRRAAFLRRIDELDKVAAITFDSHLEFLIAQSAGIVAMGGYNTFCEILSFDKPALIVPRTVPRREQLIRASRAQAMGLVRVLEDDGDYDPAVMARALGNLPSQGPPSQVVVPGLLDGLANVNRLVDDHLEPPSVIHQVAVR
jgi:predicted glycosyltransferase